MRRGTTPKVSVELKDTDLEGCRVLMTISQNHEDVGPYPNPRDRLTKRPIFPIIIQKMGDDVEITKTDKGGCVVSSILTQQDTLTFISGIAEVQLRWIDPNGNAGESDIVKTVIEPTLTNEVISYGVDEQQK